MRLRTDWEIISKRVDIIKRQIEKMEISPNLVALLVAAEDHRYGKHPGVDLISMCRATWKSLFCGKREGGSTIAMQLVRVLTGRFERTIGRKLVEIYLAIRLTRNVDAHDIPRLYLAIAYYGWQMNGLKQASKRLNFNPSNLAQREAASIIARLKYPEPKQVNEKRCIQISERAKHIIDRADRLFGNQQTVVYRLGKSNGSI